MLYPLILTFSRARRNALFLRLVVRHVLRSIATVISFAFMTLPTVNPTQWDNVEICQCRQPAFPVRSGCTATRRRSGNDALRVVRLQTYQTAEPPRPANHRANRTSPATHRCTHLARIEPPVRRPDPDKPLVYIGCVARVDTGPIEQQPRYRRIEKFQCPLGLSYESFTVKARRGEGLLSQIVGSLSFPRT
jgi:hypothetical protein